jgi:lambda family phage portal protein
MKLPARIRAAASVLLGRSFEAAGGSGRWPAEAHMPGMKSAMLAARASLASRARYLVSNNPHAAALSEGIVSLLVGPGLVARSLHRNPAVRRTLDRAFRKWAVEAGILRESLASIQEQTTRCMVHNGDAFVHMMGEGGRLSLQLLDPEQIDASLNRDLGGRRIVAGIELDVYGRPLAYYVRRHSPADPFATWSEPVRIDAADVLHLFQPLAPGAVRGISWLAPVMGRLLEIDATEDAMVVRMKVAALLAGFVRTADGEPLYGTAPTATFEPGTLSHLRPGEDVTFSAPVEVGDGPAFLKQMLRSVAAGVGLTYEQLTGDLSEVNYSSIRAGQLQVRRRATAWQKNLLVDRFLAWVWSRWAILEALSGRLDTAGWTADDWEALPDVEWLAPAWGQVDPWKETNAEIAALNARLRPRREVVASHGRDIETLDEELAEDARAA